ncbi:hypothetical protein FKM82_024020 [Ascaphus truei]
MGMYLVSNKPPTTSDKYHFLCTQKYIAALIFCFVGKGLNHWHVLYFTILKRGSSRPAFSRRGASEMRREQVARRKRASRDVLALPSLLVTCLQIMFLL